MTALAVAWTSLGVRSRLRAAGTDGATKVATTAAGYIVGYGNPTYTATKSIVGHGNSTDRDTTRIVGYGSPTYIAARAATLRPS